MFCQFILSGGNGAMARTKQATPLRRDPSSEYFSRAELATSGTPSQSPRNSDIAAGGNGTVPATGDLSKDILQKSFAPEVKEAGALQLLAALGGIYGSLYASLPPI